MGSFVDLTGQVFSRLTVLSRAEDGKHQVVRWNCQCECGNQVIVQASKLRSGNTRSCKCLLKETTTRRLTTHGQSVSKQRNRSEMSREYRAWISMKDRVARPKQDCYRNVTICDRWLNSFENFLEDMGTAPGYNYQLDRIDNRKGYSPDNCRWLTHKENQRNKTDNVVIEWQGQKRCLIEWSEILEPKLGIKYNGLQHRIQRGWSIEKAFTTPNTKNG